MLSEPDIDFIEFYIKKKYNKRLHDYFGVSKPVASGWRNSKFPDGRFMEFFRREGSMDILQLFNKLYLKED